MFDDEQEISNLHIETRTWNKFEKKMKEIGFREGAAKGKDISLQQGFNLGYLDGFKVGEYLGMVKGIASCQKELGVSTKHLDEKYQGLLTEACVLCSKNQKFKTPLSKDVYSEKLENIISRQQILNNKIIATLEKLDFNKYVEKT